MQDNARLHIAALTDSDIKNERIFAFTDPFTWNEILDVLRTLRPNHKLPQYQSNNDKDMSKVLKKDRAEEILSKHYGKKLALLEETLRDNIAHLE